MNTHSTIPKKIHFCWFGRGEKPDIVKKSMESWKNILHDYDLVEWNEDNVDLTCNPYVKEAFEAKKYAFVSDYVRVHALYHYGGIYLDTDVEVFKSFDDLLSFDSFWGFEQENYIATSTIGAAKGNLFIKEFLDLYEGRKFLKEDGSFDDLTNVAMVTNMLGKYGLKLNGEFQRFGQGNDVVYPQYYFSPYDYINCRNFKTEETYAMHHFYKSWLPPKARFKSEVKKLTSKVIGGHAIARIRKMVQ